MKERESIAGRLAAFSLERRITILVLLLTILVGGFIAIEGIPRELFPRGYESKFLRVQVPWPNAPAEEVLEKITLPLEEELSTVKGLVHLNTFSSQSSSSAFLQFKRGVDVDVAYREVRDRVERARLQFPEDVEQALVLRDDPDDFPVAMLGLAIDPSINDPYSLVEKKVMRRIKRLDGVASVRADGVAQKEILIEIDKRRADAHRLNIYQMAQDLDRDNFTMASGHVEQGGRKFLLRSLATYATVDEIRNRPISEDLRLGDVADIRYEEPERKFSVRVNGRPAVAVIIFKEGEANTVDLGERIEAEVEAMRSDPVYEGVQMELFFNQGRIIQSQIGNLAQGGRIGGLFAILILYLFLKRMRMTLVVSASIPLSLLVALLTMYFAGESLNMITILGLVICVGLLVDNSIVVSENIYRRAQDGEPLRTACVRGAGEIALAISMATLTTVIVFLPVALVEGEGQFFLMRLAMPISVSLLASLGVALVFIPLGAYLTRGPRSRESLSPLQRVPDWIYRRTFVPLGRAYERMLAFSLRRRLDVFLAIVVLFGATFGAVAPRLKVVPNQEEDQQYFQIGVEMPEDSNFEQTRAFFSRLEEVMEAKKEELDLEGYLLMNFKRGGRIDGWLKPEKDYDLKAKEMMKMVIDAFPEKPGVEYQTGRESQIEEARGKEAYVLRLEGEDAGQLSDLAEALERPLLAVPGVLGVRTGRERPPNELALVVDRERSSTGNVNPEYISGVVGYALRGRRLSRFSYQGREIPVTVRYQEEDREDLDALSNFQVPSMDGRVFPLSSLTSVEKTQVSQGIFRRDKKTSHSITLDLEEEGAAETRETLDALKGAMDLPEGVSFGGQGSFAELQSEIQSLTFAGILSILFIYLLMGFLFESFILPLSIILTIPLAGTGMVWIHYLFGYDIDTLGFVGAILLIGVVVNNGIVLIDYVRRLRRSGMERGLALAEAARRRFRPIVMTAMTTIIGMIPLTLSKPTEIGLSYKSFGLTLIGGMTTATLLTLLVVPLFYTFFDDLRLLGGRALGRVLRDPPPQRG